MAGMLPGVECARRRRFHGGAPPIEFSNTASVVAGQVWTRRPSFTLYTANNESHQAYISFSERNVKSKSYYEDEKLDGAAKEAKERLDKRLNISRKRSVC
ncbi:unnamed protein product [Cochlearia groenlandica]